MVRISDVNLMAQTSPLSASTHFMVSPCAESFSMAA